MDYKSPEKFREEYESSLKKLSELKKIQHTKPEVFIVEIHYIVFRKSSDGYCSECNSDHRACCIDGNVVELKILNEPIPRSYFKDGEIDDEDNTFDISIFDKKEPLILNTYRNRCCEEYSTSYSTIKVVALD